MIDTSISRNRPRDFRFIKYLQNGRRVRRPFYFSFPRDGPRAEGSLFSFASALSPLGVRFPGSSIARARAHGLLPRFYPHDVSPAFDAERRSNQVGALATIDGEWFSMKLAVCAIKSNPFWALLIIIRVIYSAS